jgi:hypothetical protein
MNSLQQGATACAVFIDTGHQCTCDAQEDARHALAGRRCHIGDTQHWGVLLIIHAAAALVFRDYEQKRPAMVQ